MCLWYVLTRTAYKGEESETTEESERKFHQGPFYRSISRDQLLGSSSDFSSESTTSEILDADADNPSDHCTEGRGRDRFSDLLVILDFHFFERLQLCKIIGYSHVLKWELRVALSSSTNVRSALGEMSMFAEAKSDSAKIRSLTGAIC